MFSVAENDFGRFLQKRGREIGATHIYQNHTILEIKIFDRSNEISIESTTYSFSERTLSFSASSPHCKASRCSKRPEDSITFYDPRADSHPRGNAFEKFRR